MRFQKLVSLLIALFFVLQLHAQSFDYTSKWKEIESLSDKGLFDQALKQTKLLLEEAQKEQNSVQSIKALIHQFNYSQQFEEDAVVKSIEQLELLQQKVSGVEQALIEAAMADLYMFYFQNNSWQINQRKDISGTRPTDMAYWTKKHFKTEIESLLQSALSHEKALKETSSEYWKEIFVKDTLGFEVFPTLYDFVAWKAIDFYSDYDFQNQAQEDLLVLNDPKLFGNSEQFLEINFKDFDSTFFKIKVLEFYQQLIRTHKENKNTRPLLFLESKRLKYVQDNGQIDNKHELINKSLQKELNDFKGRPGSEYIAQTLIRNYSKSEKEAELEKALSICNEMIELGIEKVYFEYEQNRLLAKELYITTNSELLPNTPSFAQVKFKNVDSIWVKIIEINESIEKYSRDEDMFDRILKLNSVSDFSIVLSSKERLIEKTALIDLPSLNYGQYAVIVSSGHSFDDTKDKLAGQLFWVTRLQFLSNSNSGPFMVIDRENGEPIEKAKVEIFVYHWEYSSRSQIQTSIGTFYTDKNGMFDYSSPKSENVSIKISKAQDEYEIKSSHISPNNFQTEKTTEKHYFFTDRAIYRPGQTAYFKGIFMERKGKEKKALVDHSAEIKIYGANGKQIESLNLISNEYGSVSGSFTIPLNNATGSYRISTKNGNTYFKVEEYKRPKFEVNLESPKEEFKLNDEIKIMGKANYFAGNGLQNAKVRYRVSRISYNPWRYSFWPNFEKLAIDAGESSTNENGEFEISFQAKAPILDGITPWFNYQISVEVIDETGETHQDILDVRLGETSMFISSNLPDGMNVEKAKDVMVHAETPNGQTLHPVIELKLEKLEIPNQLQKQIEYSFDTLLISEDKIQKEFSDYQFEKNPLKVEAIVLQKTLDTKIDSIIPKSIFKSLPLGKYRMTLSSKDKYGIPIIDSAEFLIFSTQKNELAEPMEFFSYINKSSIEVGDTLVFSFGTSYKKPKFYYQLSYNYNIFESKWLTSIDEFNHIRIPIKEEFRGGFVVQIFFMKDNKFIQKGGLFQVPFSNEILDVQLTTFRNPLEPGKKEKWSLKIKNNKGETESAEVLAAMYDASLDEFRMYEWSPWRSWYSNGSFYWRKRDSYAQQLQQRLFYNHEYLSQPSPLELSWMFYANRLMRESYGMYDKGAPGMSVQNDAIATTVGGVYASPEVEAENYMEEEETKQEEKSIQMTEKPVITPRKNLKETAFFYPQLKTDKEGNIELNFTSPEALTRWKLMVLAHTKDMKIGQLTQEVTTQKELMVMPNLPRFLRGGDEITISTKVLNLLEETQPIKARLEIMDAATQEPLSLLVAGQAKEQSLSLQANGQEEVSWMIQVPEKLGAVIIRITAQGDQHSDGEEHILPVLSQLHFLTDTYPFALSNKDNISAADLNVRLKDRNTDDELTLEIVSNPLWYVVQAIPDYQAPQKLDALQWMNYFYIQSMAFHIVKENPEIEEVFKQWQMNAPEELESELFQNPELKKVMMEETPWLLNAESQSQRKQAIARLFDENNLQNQLQTALQKLQEMQKPNGGFGWIDGMKTSPWISAQIASSLGQLLEAGILDLDKDYKSKNIIRQLVNYLDDELEIAYQKAKKDKNSYSNESDILLARSYFLEFAPLKKGDQAFDFFLNKWKEKMHQKSISERMKLARLLWKSNQKEESLELIAAIQDIALTDEYGGIYWRDFQRYQSVSQQAEMIALFEMTNQEPKWIEGVKLWLLEQKRANDWGSSSATARACLIMIHQAPQLSKSPKVFININGEEQLIGGNAGTGYFKQTFKGKEIVEVLKNLKVRKEGEGMIFGAVYDQYFEKMSEVQSHSGGVTISKQLYVSKIQGDATALIPVDADTRINLGDRILVRMTLENEQAMDFVHLRDYLPAGFENQNPLSGYRWQGDVSYYQSPGDVATDYFIPHLPKRKFVIEYELNATISGILNSGPAEIQSLYAPEFGGHSEGEMIEVVR